MTEPDHNIKTSWDRDLRSPILLAVALMATIVLANFTLDRLGMWSIGPFMIASGVIWAGIALTLRDWLQEEGGTWWVPPVIVLGALLSWFVAGPEVAVASGAAFLFGETLDFLIYTPIRRRNVLVAVLVSNTIGGLADSWLFLSLAPFPWSAKDVIGLALAKVVVTVVTLGVLMVVGWRQSERALEAA